MKSFEEFHETIARSFDENVFESISVEKAKPILEISFVRTIVINSPILAFIVYSRLWNFSVSSWVF